MSLYRVEPNFFDPIEYLMWTDMVHRFQQTRLFTDEFPRFDMKSYGVPVNTSITDVLFSLLLLNKHPDYKSLRDKYEKYMDEMHHIDSVYKEDFNERFVKLADKALAFLKKESRHNPAVVSIRN